MQINKGIIAHRGASAYAPENTIAAFDKALALGSSFMEFDVMLSADEVPFIFHDESLKRTTNGRGEFGQMSAAHLKTLDAGAWFSKDFRHEKIPTFQEVLEWLTFADINANIEIKPYPGTVEKTTIAVLTQLTRYWPRSKPLPLISSFDYNVLILCRTIAPEIPLGFLMDQWDDQWMQKARELQCFSIHCNKQGLTAQRVQAIKEAKYALFVYTVNRKKQAKTLLNWGVDAVFSDYPDLLS